MFLWLQTAHLSNRFATFLLDCKLWKDDTAMSESSIGSLVNVNNHCMLWLWKKGNRPLSIEVKNTLCGKCPHYFVVTSLNNVQRVKQSGAIQPIPNKTVEQLLT